MLKSNSKIWMLPESRTFGATIRREWRHPTLFPLVQSYASLSNNPDSNNDASSDKNKPDSLAAVRKSPAQYLKNAVHWVASVPGHIREVRLVLDEAFLTVVICHSFLILSNPCLLYLYLPRVLCIIGQEPRFWPTMLKSPAS
mgnify:CR=1 FL=1